MREAVSARQGKARQGKARQAIQDKARQAIQDKVRELRLLLLRWLLLPMLKLLSQLELTKAVILTVHGGAWWNNVVARAAGRQKQGKERQNGLA